MSEHISAKAVRRRNYVTYLKGDGKYFTCGVIGAPNAFVAFRMSKTARMDATAINSYGNKIREHVIYGPREK